MLKRNLSSRFILIVLLCLSGLGFQAAIAKGSSADTSVMNYVSMQRTGCFGQCPIYRVEIWANGMVRYTGQQFVGVSGEKTYRISRRSAQRVFSMLRSKKYLRLKDKYDNMSVTDLPSVITSARLGKSSRGVTHYTGDDSAPKWLNTLYETIDRSARTKNLIKQVEQN